MKPETSILIGLGMFVIVITGLTFSERPKPRIPENTSVKTREYLTAAAKAFCAELEGNRCSELRVISRNVTFVSTHFTPPNDPAPNDVAQLLKRLGWHQTKYDETSSTQVFCKEGHAASYYFAEGYVKNVSFYSGEDKCIAV
jgi:hypothetical protein